MNGKLNPIYTAVVVLVISFANIDRIVGQQKLGDNLGNHIAKKSLNMNNHNLNNVQVANAENVIIGTVGQVTNTSVALQVNGSNTTILIPRVTGLLDSSNPAIPAANAIEGMIVYDLTTHKFYVRDNLRWVSYASGKLDDGKTFVGDISGTAQQVTVSGDITFSSTGISTIGSSKVSASKLTDRSITSTKFGPGGAGQYLKTNAAANAVSWETVPELTTNYVNLTSDQNTIKGFKTFVSDSGLVAAGTFGIGTLPANGAGTRLMWYPKKAAFRTGSLDAISSLDANIGNYSTAMGNGAIASGESSFATGKGKAQGNYSTALGTSTASGLSSFAAGNSEASGDYSVATGASTASGAYSVAMGRATASGANSIAFGNLAVASGRSSMALGSNNNTNNKVGSFIFTDVSGAQLSSTVDAQFTARFVGGYQFNADIPATLGPTISAGGNSWTTVSDKRKKENFVSLDAHSFLTKLDTLYLSSWNYRGQNKAHERHYGAMAQDFYAAFGHDSLGAIGNDTTLTSADVDGVLMIAIQGLVKQSNALKVQNELQIKRNLAQINETLKPVNSLNLNAKLQSELISKLLGIENKLDLLKSEGVRSKKNKSQIQNTATLRYE